MFRPPIIFDHNANEYIVTFISVIITSNFNFPTFTSCKVYCVIITKCNLRASPQTLDSLTVYSLVVYNHANILFQDLYHQSVQEFEANLLVFSYTSPIHPIFSFYITTSHILSPKGRSSPGRSIKAPPTITAQTKTAMNSLVYATTTSNSIHAFRVLHNNGGRRAIDCGLISIKQAAQQAGIVGYFDTEIDEIRIRMAHLLRTLKDNTTVCNIARCFLPERDIPEHDDPLPPSAMERVCHCVENESLSSEIIRLYERIYHPSQANLIVCSETSAGIYTCTNPPYALDPNLKFIFIGCSPARSHFEALIPVDPGHVIADLNFIDGWKETHRYELKMEDGTAMVIHSVCEADGTTLLHTELTGTRRYSGRHPIVRSIDKLHASDIRPFRFDSNASSAADNMDEILLMIIEDWLLINTLSNLRLF